MGLNLAKRSVVFQLRRAGKTLKCIAEMMHVTVDEVRAALPRPAMTAPVKPSKKYISRTGKRRFIDPSNQFYFEAWPDQKRAMEVWDMIYEMHREGRPLECLFANFDLTETEQEKVREHLVIRDAAIKKRA